MRFVDPGLRTVQDRSLARLFPLIVAKGFPESLWLWPWPRDALIPVPPSAKAMWEIAFGGGRITCIVLGVWGRPEGARDDGEAPFVPSSPHRTLAAPDANDDLRPCPADVSLFEAAVVFVVSPTTACKGLASRPPAVEVQRAVHKMPISVGQRPRETKHGKCDLARDPNPATCCQRRPVIQIPGRCSCCRSSFSRLNIALQALQCQGANRLAAREELSSVRRGLTGSSGQLGGGPRCLRTYDQDVRSPM